MAVPRSSRLFLKEFLLFCPLFCMYILIQTAAIFVLFPSSVHLKRMDSAVSEIIVLRAGSLPSITSSFCELSHLFKFLACTHLSPRFLRTCRKHYLVFLTVPHLPFLILYCGSWKPNLFFCHLSILHI